MTLHVHDLGRRFGTRVALDGVSLDVDAGEIHGFVGVNGAGKSTTMRIVAGLLAADRGTVTWRGAQLDEHQRRKFALMPEQRGLYPRMRVAEQLEFFAQLRGMTRRDARASVNRWLHRLGLGAAAGHELRALSHGNQQRVQLAASLVARPELLLLDEPFSGLDVVGTQLLSEILVEVAENGVAVLFSSHQLELVEALCARLTIIDGGRTIVSAGIRELKASGSATLEIDVEANSSDWVRTLPGVEVLRCEDRRLRVALADGVDTEDVLDAARAAGRVRTFAQTEPQLGELLMNIVNGRPAADRVQEVIA